MTRATTILSWAIVAAVLASPPRRQSCSLQLAGSARKWKASREVSTTDFNSQKQRRAFTKSTLR
jgi:hypothetical protein